MAISKKAQAAIDGALSLDAPSDQVGLGVDIVEVARMRRILERTPSFAARTFSEGERAYCDGQADPAKHYAARFAAKEAALKALGTGFAAGIGVRDVEVSRSAKGRPTLVLHGCARELARTMGVTDMPLSLSHSTSDAIACVIAITEGSQAAARKRVDPTEELTRQFKEARGMLDSL